MKNVVCEKTQYFFSVFLLLYDFLVNEAICVLKDLVYVS